MSTFDPADPGPDEERPPPVAVPPEALAPETLRAVVEAFVLREGTDYGERDVAFDTKVQQVLAQLARGEAALFYDPASESVTITTGRPRARG